MKCLAERYELFEGDLWSLACKLPWVQIDMVELGNTCGVIVGLIILLCCDSDCETWKQRHYLKSAIYASLQIAQPGSNESRTNLQSLALQVCFLIQKELCFGLLVHRGVFSQGCPTVCLCLARGSRSTKF